LAFKISTNLHSSNKDGHWHLTLKGLSVLLLLTTTSTIQGAKKKRWKRKAHCLILFKLFEAMATLSEHQ
jgi:hypothetical protein